MHHLAEISIDRLVNDTTLVSGSHWERVIRSGNTKLSCCGLIHSMHLTYTLAPFFPLTGSQDRGYFVSFFLKGVHQFRFICWEGIRASEHCPCGCRAPGSSQKQLTSRALIIG